MPGWSEWSDPSICRSRTWCSDRSHRCSNGRTAWSTRRGSSPRERPSRSVCRQLAFSAGFRPSSPRSSFRSMCAPTVTLSFAYGRLPPSHVGLGRTDQKSEPSQRTPRRARRPPRIKTPRLGLGPGWSPTKARVRRPTAPARTRHAGRDRRPRGTGPALARDTALAARKAIPSTTSASPRSIGPRNHSGTGGGPHGPNWGHPDPKVAVIVGQTTRA